MLAAIERSYIVLTNPSIFYGSKADPMWAPFTALKYKELGLLISAREVDLPISLELTDSIKH